MKAYLLITGSLFGLMGALHFWIAVEERASLKTNPVEFLIKVALGVLATAIAAWAWRLFRRQPR